MQDFEKLGTFYLGKVFDGAANRPTEDLLLYDSKDLTTHAVREMRDRQIEKLRQRYGPKLSMLQERIRRAEDKVEREDAQVEDLHAKVSPDRMAIEAFHIRPRKGDMTIQTVGLVWTPWRLTGENLLEPLY